METKQIIEEILTKMETGWNNADGAAFANSFAQVSDFVDIRGTLHAGATAQQLGHAHQELFMSIYKDSKVKYKLVQVVQLDEITILAHADADLNAPSGPLAGKSGSTISMLICKPGNDWKIRAFHNTLKMKQ